MSPARQHAGFEQHSVTNIRAGAYNSLFLGNVFGMLIGCMAMLSVGFCCTITMIK
jgi:hypothetical protein